ncbi:peptidase S16 [Actinomyces sp. B33]|uniref:YlbL family protein n=1 Tax=Actinomyces sp. B33 TaxID=2942131 RepID=UPI00233FD420|nr:S16 family serine protease [Actinomyces sp. B33]MDC4233863.1 peptidase S16 [Actinomyces sp. B33]
MDHDEQSTTSPRPPTGAPGGGEAPAPAKGRRAGRTRALRLTGWALIALAAVVVFVLPVPYVVDKPGPTFNVLGSRDGTAVIEVSGTDPATGSPLVPDATDEAGDAAAPADGRLLMVTVSESGGPGNRMTLAALAVSALDPRNTVVAYSDVYPDDVTAEQIEQAAQAQMSSSQSTAEVAALEHLGWSVPATVTVAGAVPGSHAEGVVEAGDVLVSITDPQGVVHPVDSASVPFSLMRRQPVGSVMTLTVERDGRSLDLPVESVAGGEQEEGSKLGVYLTADVSLPIDIAVNLDKVGGPSAGMVFALGIIDRLTPGDLTGGQSIAGTGTISYDGAVGPIGGVRQKMWGARADGAQWFLAPAGNCSEIAGHAPEGLTVVPVATLDEALAAVDAIRLGRPDSLAACPAG